MILWCMSCKEYRKRGSNDWHRCEYKDRHRLVPAIGRMEEELQGIRDRISERKRPENRTTRTSRCWACWRAIKNAKVVDNDEKGRLNDLVEKMMGGSASLLHDPEAVFYWIRTGGEWDVLKSDSDFLERLIADEYKRAYGESVYDFYVRAVVQAYEHRAIRENTVDRVWRRMGFDGKSLWFDLNGRPRRLYRVAPGINGPSVPYTPDMNMVFERHGDEMPEPEHADGRWLERFCGLLGIREDLREAFCVHLCHMFCVHQETPPMVFSGPPGSGKTVAGTLVRDLVNPVGPRNAAWAMPKGLNRLNDALSYSPVVLFDPVSRIGRECRRCALRRVRRRRVPAARPKARGSGAVWPRPHTAGSAGRPCHQVSQFCQPNPALRDAAALQVAS